MVLLLLFWLVLTWSHWFLLQVFYLGCFHDQTWLSWFFSTHLTMAHPVPNFPMVAVELDFGWRRSDGWFAKSVSSLAEFNPSNFSFWEHGLKSVKKISSFQSQRANTGSNFQGFLSHLHLRSDRSLGYLWHCYLHVGPLHPEAQDIQALVTLWTQAFGGDYWYFLILFAG